MTPPFTADYSQKYVLSLLPLLFLDNSSGVTPFVLSWCRALTCNYILPYVYLPDRLSALPDYLGLSRYLDT